MDDATSSSQETKQLSPKDYDAAFGVSRESANAVASSSNKQAEALKHALDIRKFEISLYWTRAAYFWTFIALALGGYVAVQTRQGQAQSQLSILISCVGFVFSFAWYCANRGSKQWQENWENHVDLLEDGITGPLYKVVIKRPQPQTWSESAKRLLIGPDNFSVSKINQLISVYVTALWALLLVNSMVDSGWRNWPNWVGLILTIGACTAIYCLARTHQGSHYNEAYQRKSGVIGGKDAPEQVYKLDEISLRILLGELYQRSRTYTAQAWQVPLAYLGLITLSITQVAEKDSILVRLVCVAGAIFGIAVFAHFTGMLNGAKRAIKHINDVERMLSLPSTTKYMALWYTWSLGILIVLGILFLIGLAIFPFTSAGKVDPYKPATTEFSYLIEPNPVLTNRI